VEDDRKQSPSSEQGSFNRESIKPDQNIQIILKDIEDTMKDSIKPKTLEHLNGYQRREILGHFEKSQELQIKSYNERGEILLRIYPIGKLKRLAEQKTQEVLMKGKAEILPPMGSFERFIIHDYLKEREGIRTESFGESGKDRHVEISSLFGRNLKKVKKRRLT
jgi:hypothetical protein